MTILAAIGGEYERDSVIEVGYDLAIAYNDELVVLHVMNEEQFEELRENSEIVRPVMVPDVEGGTGLVYNKSKQSLPEYNLEDGLSDAANIAEKCVSQTLSGEQRAEVTTRGRIGDPTTEIVEEARRIDARFIVVGGRKRSPTGKAIFGSTSQSVILNSNRPVVATTRDEI